MLEDIRFLELWIKAFNLYTKNYRWPFNSKLLTEIA